jgi:hypothetical protein
MHLHTHAYTPCTHTDTSTDAHPDHECDLADLGNASNEPNICSSAKSACEEEEERSSEVHGTCSLALRVLRRLFDLEEPRGVPG